MTGIPARHQKAAVKAYEGFMRNPEAFVRLAFGVELWEKQREVLQAVFQHKRTAVKSGHKVGKTHLMAHTALAFLMLVRPSVVITTAPTWRQVEKQLWQEIHAACDRAKYRGLPIGGELLTTQLKFGAKHFGFGFSSEHTEGGVNFQGFSGNVFFLFDEAGGIPQNIWDVVETSMVSAKARWLVAGNPHDPASPFWKCFGSKLWKPFTVSSWDTPNSITGREIIPGLATREWCEERKAEWGEEDPRYQFRVLGEFPDASAFSLIRTSWLRAAQKAEPKTGGVRAGGCDVARFGDDDTVIVGFDGGHLLPMEVIHGADVVNVAGAVARAYKRNKWECVAIDDTGVGGGVTDVLVRDRELNVIPVNFGEAANDNEHYANRVTEMFASFAESLKLGEVSGFPEDEELCREFTARKYEFTLTQQMKLWPKKKFKEEIGRSPDRADAILLADWARKVGGSGVCAFAQVFA